MDAFRRFINKEVALVCNEEAVLQGLPWNRYVRRYGWSLGTFFICGLGEEDFISLTEEQVKRHSEGLFPAL